MIYVNQEKVPAGNHGTQQMAICADQSELVASMKDARIIRPTQYVSRDGKIYKAILSTTNMNKLLKEDGVTLCDTRRFIAGIRAIQG